MMEKYGVEEQENTFEVVLPDPRMPDDFRVLGSQLSLPAATKLQNEYRGAIIRPEK